MSREPTAGGSVHPWRQSAATGTLSGRDRAVVELVGKFRQLTSGHIRLGLFADLASTTPLDRTLRRLVETKHLSHLRRLIGGDQGGSAQYVYQLGRAGWRLLARPGAYWAPRAVNLHALAVADCYVTLMQTERDTQFELIRFTTEPDCHQTVGDVLLTPDAYVEVGNRAERIKYSYWLEVDRGTEHLDKIRQKCERYWRAYHAWQSEYYPRVIFVVPDRQRRSAIEQVISNGPAGASALFVACAHGELLATLLSP